MFYYNDENSIIEYSKRYSNRMKNSRVNIDQVKNDSRYSDVYSLFFKERRFNYFAGDSLYLEGTTPPVSFDFVYRALNRKTFQAEPWYMIMDQCSDFFELYDASIQDRSSFVATNKIIKAEDYVIPLFIIFLNARNIYSKISPMLFVHDGQIVLRFEYNSAVAISSYSFEKSQLYDFLINVLKLEDKKTVNHILENELEIKKEESILLIKKKLYSVRHYGKKERIIDYIKSKRIISAQELADYFNLSKRMINYYIADLIKDGIVIREGESNSSFARYRINPDNYYF